MNTNYIAYYRVSTHKQGIRGLGMEAQRDEVLRFINGGQVIAQYTEVESGKRSDNRPELLRALAHCQASGAVLIIARLDRLSRNLAFIANLIESKVKFKCCDMPEADTFTIHILAAVAQKERELISGRVKAALKVLQDRGVKLGGPNAGKAHCDHMRSCRTPTKYDPILLDLVRKDLAAGLSLSQIADNLNKLNIKTSRGSAFTPVQVFRLKKAIANN